MEQSGGAKDLLDPKNDVTIHNETNLEMAWAEKAFKRAEIHEALLKMSKDRSKLKLTKYDDQVYQLFRERFPNLSVEIVTEEDLKNKEAKEKWRPFCMEFEKVVEEYNYATLLRKDCKLEYNEYNSYIVPKIQWLAIEVARNKEGYNNKYGEKKK